MGGRREEVQVFDRVASLPQVKGNLASCREGEGKKEGKREKSISLECAIYVIRVTSFWI